MAVYSRAALSALIASRLADNTSSQISPADHRQTDLDTADSAAFPEDLKPEALSAQDRLQELTDGATINWDVADGPNASVVLGGNRTFAAPTNLEAGMILTLLVRQDSTGSRTITWNAAFVWAGASAPTLTTTAHRVDVFTFVAVYDGTNVVLVERSRTLNLNIGTGGGGLIET